MSLTLLSLIAAGFTPAATDTCMDNIASNLKHPPSDYTCAPFWVWNDWMTADQVTQALDDFAAQNILQPIVHPRPGLMTPYLMDDWFAMWKTAIDVAHKNGMKLWIYDENSYPSGFAGGYVPDAMPESRALGLVLRSEKGVSLPDPAIIAVYRKSDAGWVNATAALMATPADPNEELLVARTVETGSSPWFGGKFYVDLLHPGVTQKFLEITLEPYRSLFGDEFGKTIPGVFTDEPHLRPCGDIHWTPDLPTQFQKRWGYAIEDVLASLKEDSPQGRRLRHNYFQLINDLFIERWAKPYHDYCEQYGLDFTGHYWEHEWPHCATVPDNMAMNAWQQRPGIDILFNQYDEGPHAQFGNTRAVLELASVANQMGRQRTLCETFGGSGAEMRFEDFKRIGDWVMVLGVNTMNEHLSHATLRGARKRDYPPTFSYHEPWWHAYHVLSTYFQRVTYALSQGQQLNPCLVLEPTTTAWMHHFTDGSPINAIGDEFQKLVVDLSKAQLEFDLGSEYIIGAFGANTQASPTPSADDASKSLFVVGQRAYAAVVVPPLMENLNQTTFDHLKAYLDQGGVVFSCAGEQPTCIDGQPNPACDVLRASPNWRLTSPAELPALLNAQCPLPTRVSVSPESRGILYHHRRQLPDGEILFLVNTSADAPASGSITTHAASIRQACLDTGSLYACPCEPQPDGATSMPFSLPPCGSLMLLLDKKPVAAEPAPRTDAPRNAVALSAPSIQRRDDNVLILDYVDVAAKDKSLNAVFWRNAAALTFEANGLHGNLWDHAVQFKDELMNTTFPPRQRLLRNLPLPHRRPGPRTPLRRRRTRRPLRHHLQRPPRRRPTQRLVAGPRIR